MLCQGFAWRSKLTRLQSPTPRPRLTGKSFDFFYVRSEKGFGQCIDVIHKRFTFSFVSRRQWGDEVLSIYGSCLREWKPRNRWVDVYRRAWQLAEVLWWILGENAGCQHAKNRKKKTFIVPFYAHCFSSLARLSKRRHHLVVLGWFLSCFCDQLEGRKKKFEVSFCCRKIYSNFPCFHVKLGIVTWHSSRHSWHSFIQAVSLTKNILNQVPLPPFSADLAAAFSSLAQHVCSKTFF